MIRSSRSGRIRAALVRLDFTGYFHGADSPCDRLSHPISGPGIVRKTGSAAFLVIDSLHFS